MFAMSRTSSDQNYIPLRSLGRGRRKPLRTYSSVSSLRNSDLGSGLTEIASGDDDRSSTDEAPLIPKDEVTPAIYGLFDL